MNPIGPAANSTANYVSTNLASPSPPPVRTGSDSDGDQDGSVGESTGASGNGQLLNVKA